MSWPPMTIKFDPDKGAILHVAGLPHKEIPPGPSVRALAMQEAQAVAAQYKRTITVTATEPKATYIFEVSQDGTIADLTDPKAKKKQQPKEAQTANKEPEPELEILQTETPTLEEEIPLVQVPDFYPSDLAASLDQTLAPQDLDDQPLLPQMIPADTANTGDTVKTVIAVNAGDSEPKQEPSEPTSPQTAETQANESLAATELTEAESPHDNAAKTVNAGDTVKAGVSGPEPEPEELSATPEVESTSTDHLITANAVNAVNAGVDTSERIRSEEPQESTETTAPATESVDEEENTVNAVNAGVTEVETKVDEDTVPELVGWYDLGKSASLDEDRVPEEYPTVNAVNAGVGYPSKRDLADEPGQALDDAQAIDQAGDQVAEPYAAPTSPQRSRTRMILIAGTVVVGLAIGGTGIWWATNAYQESQLASAQSQFLTSTQLLSVESNVAKETLERGQDVLEMANLEVIDEIVVSALRSAVQELGVLVEAPRAAQPGKERTALVEAAIVVEARSTALTDAASKVDTAIAGIEDAVAVWELAQAQEAWTTAKTGLDSAITTAEQAVKDLTGKVTDNKTIEALTKAVTDARTTLEAKVDESTAATVAAGTTALVTATDAIGNASKTANDSNAAWVKAEEAKRAAAKAATEQVAPPVTAPAAPNAPAKPKPAGTQAAPKKPATKTPTPTTSKPQAPAQKKPAAGKITGLSSSVSSSGGGKATVSVTVKGSGSGKVSITVAGKSTSLSVTAPGTYSTTLTGLKTGSQSWSSSVAGMTNSGSLTIY